ncbi:MAG: hypothetical protein LBQ57_10010 [Spirochaetales bacterium]|nr:hypothetical protein [Spirochaetales bacterium]
MKKPGIIFIALLALLAACGNQGPDVYIVGSYGTGEIGKACYWLNGVRTELPGGTWAQAITMADGKIHIVGYSGKNWQDSSRTACYWIDGVKTDLPGPEGSVATSIVVANGKTYIAGSYRHKDGQLVELCYWVDGKVNHTNITTALPKIAVLDGRLYITGIIGGRRQPRYWVDGVIKEIGAHRDEGLVRAITVSGGKVYMAGVGFNGSSNEAQACYWVDGQRKELSGGQAISIAVLDGKVYIAGIYDRDINSAQPDYQACYWVDGQRKELSGNGATSITVSGGKVYIAGMYKTDNDGRQQACYWVDGQRKDLPDGSFASGILLIEKEQK